jgi:high-affinity Fe2+/Pb2+ permease
MILPSLAATASSGRSVAAWAYDVSKSVASAMLVAFGIAVVGKGIGWGTFTRLKWTTLLLVIPLVLLEMLIILGAILNGVPDSSGDLISWGVLIGLGLSILGICRHQHFLEPAPLVTSSHANAAPRSDTP